MRTGFSCSTLFISFWSLVTHKFENTVQCSRNEKNNLWNRLLSVLTYRSGRRKSQNQQHQCQSGHPVFGRLSPLSEPQSSPSSPEPRHNSQRDLRNVSSLSLRGSWTWITIKFLLPSDIIRSLQTSTSPSETVRRDMRTVLFIIVVNYCNCCVYL